MNKIIDVKPGDRILVSRSDRLGDLILALPLVETLKVRYPECSIEVMASLYASPILEHNRRIDYIFRVQNDQLAIDRPYKKDLLRRIAQRRYQAVIAVYPEKRICQLYYKVGIPIRIGTAGRFHSVFFNYHVMHSRKSNVKHEYEYNQDFLQFFREGETVSTPRVYLQPKEIDFAARILEHAGVTGSFVVIHPGSGGSAERWPLERFVRLDETLTSRGLTVVISGSEREGEMIDAISARTGVRVNKITGQTDLRTLAAVLSLATVVVANSTGPLHLATAVDTKVVGLYSGKAVMSPRRWGPLGDDHRVLQPTRVRCQCPPRKCRCMETITVAQVAEEVMALFHKVDAVRTAR
ncbi:MAG TPA: glycosyltransferase family 9 protein [Candidatus Deferrimicrobium sp.]|nr:glycosyltransferase family 9 protein [Candidatus Deferrimicrobium sp.]